MGISFTRKRKQVGRQVITGGAYGIGREKLGEIWRGSEKFSEPAEGKSMFGKDHREVRQEAFSCEEVGQNFP